MIKKLLIIAGLYFSSCWSAADGNMQAIHAAHALYNPKGVAQVQVKETGENTKKKIEWFLLHNEDLSKLIKVRFSKNKLRINGNDFLEHPVSIYVSGGLATNLHKGPKDARRSFDYYPVLRFLALDEAMNIKWLKNKRKKIRINILFPHQIRKAESLEEVQALYEGAQKSALIIDLLAVLNYCNPEWKEKSPICQIPRVVSFQTAVPYAEVTQEQLDNSDSEEEGSCLIL